LYKSLKQTRLGAQKDKNIMLYLEVKKNNIRKDIPFSKDDMVRGASLSANLNLGQCNNTDFSCDDSKILDGVTSWVHIHGVDFNLKQTLMMGIYACTLMNGHGSQSLWEVILAKSGKAVANVLWEVLRGESPPASAKNKGHNLTDDVSLLETIALSGVTCVFGDKNSFAELAKNLGAKFKKLQKSNTLGFARYMFIIAKTYAFFKDFRFRSSTSIYNTKCKNMWSPSALAFWQKVATKVGTIGYRVNKDAITAAIEEVEASKEFECSHEETMSNSECSQLGDDEHSHGHEARHGDPMAKADVSQNVAYTSFSSPDEGAISNKIVTPESVVDDAVICNQNSDNKFRYEDTETLLLQRYESHVTTRSPEKESHNVLGRLIEICNKVTNVYGAEDDDCKRYWIQEPTEADFQALVDEDTGDMAGA